MRPKSPQALPVDTTLQGIFATIAATLLFSCQDVITKHLTASVPIPQIILIRFFFFSLFALAFAHHRIGIKTAFQSKRLMLQIVRGILIVFEVGIFAAALNRLGVAETHSLFATFPLIITALSGLLLGERVSAQRWFAVFLGFVGTLIILKPGLDLLNTGSMLALISALMFALYNLITRKVSAHDPFETSLLYFGVVGLVLSAVVAPFVWQPMSGNSIAWLSVLTISGISGHLLLIKALELTPAVILQPFNYFPLIWAIPLGYLIYQEVLSPSTLAGAALIVASGGYIAWREYRRAGVKLG